MSCTLRSHQKTSNNFPEFSNVWIVANWTFLTNHARVLLCIAHDPGARLRDIAASLGITERSAYGIVTDLTAAGYVIKQKDGRRNRYQIQAHLPLPEPTGRERTVGEVLALLAGDRREAVTDAERTHVSPTADTSAEPRWRSTPRSPSATTRAPTRRSSTNSPCSQGRT